MNHDFQKENLEQKFQLETPNYISEIFLENFVIYKRKLVNLEMHNNTYFKEENNKDVGIKMKSISINFHTIFLSKGELPHVLTGTQSMH